MSLNPRNLDQHAESRRPRTKLESRRAEEGEFDISEFTDKIQREAEGEFSRIPNFNFSSLVVTMQTQQEAEEEFEGIPGFVTESSLNEE